jgi:hypothetical protein
MPPPVQFEKIGIVDASQYKAQQPLVPFGASRYLGSMRVIPRRSRLKSRRFFAEAKMRRIITSSNQHR